MYWANDVADMDALAQEVRPVVETIGTPVQQARYHILLVLEALRRSRFSPDEEALERAGTAVAAARASGELTEIAFAEFVLGFCHMWRNELDDAEPHMAIALEIAEQDRRHGPAGHVAHLPRRGPAPSLRCRRRPGPPPALPGGGR